MTLDKYTNVQINSTEQLLESNSTALADLPAHIQNDFLIAQND
jgi:hypothetical protein